MTLYDIFCHTQYDQLLSVELEDHGNDYGLMFEEEEP